MTFLLGWVTSFKVDAILVKRAHSSQISFVGGVRGSATGTRGALVASSAGLVIQGHDLGNEQCHQRSNLRETGADDGYVHLDESPRSRGHVVGLVVGLCLDIDGRDAQARSNDDTYNNVLAPVHLQML